MRPLTVNTFRILLFLIVGQASISGDITACPSPNEQGQSTDSSPTPNPYPYGVKVLSPTEGVDIEPYVKKLHASIRNNLYAKGPDSAAKGEKGIVVVRFQVQKDGTLSDKSLTIVSSSGSKDLDEGTLKVIRTAAPSGNLPEAYRRPSLDLQFTFYYNTPREPVNKP